MRDACSILALSPSNDPSSPIATSTPYASKCKLTFVEFTVPAACYRPEIATLGPYGLKIIGYRWEYMEVVEDWGWVPVLDDRPGCEIDDLPLDGSASP